MTNINLSWIVKLVVLMAGIGVVLGVSVYHNIDASAPGAVATPPTGASQTDPVAQPLVMIPQIDPAAVDRMFYPFQKALETERQFNELRITTAERLSQIAERQIEIEGREKELDLQRGITQQQANQDQDLHRTFGHVAMGAGVGIVAALAVSMMIFAALAGWGRLKVDRARTAQMAAQTRAAALDAKASDQQEQLNQIWRAVGELTRQQTQLKNEFAAKYQTVASLAPTVPSHRKYDELPLAVIKDD